MPSPPPPSSPPPLPPPPPSPLPSPPGALTTAVAAATLAAAALAAAVHAAVHAAATLAAAALAAAALAAAATNVPSAADCLPRLTYLDLTQTRSWDDEGGVTGPVPEWLLDRLDFMAPLRLANNALDDPTAAETAVAISRLWQRCQTLGAGQCSGVPPIGCSAFNRQGRRRGERAQMHDALATAGALRPAGRAAPGSECGRVDRREQC